MIACGLYIIESVLRYVYAYRCIGGSDRGLGHIETISIGKNIIQTQWNTGEAGLIVVLESGYASLQWF